MEIFLEAIFAFVSLSVISSATVLKESVVTKLTEPPRESTPPYIDIMRRKHQESEGSTVEKPARETTPRNTMIILSDKYRIAFPNVDVNDRASNTSTLSIEEYDGETKNNESNPIQREHGTRGHPHRKRPRHHHERKNKFRHNHRRSHPYHNRRGHFYRREMMKESDRVMPRRYHQRKNGGSVPMIHKRHHQEMRGWSNEMGMMRAYPTKIQN